jgi:hypothetical protein
MAARSGWDAFSILGEYFRENGDGDPNGGRANGRFTIILAEATVQIPDENSDRTTAVNMTIAFTNAGGLPASLDRRLKDLGVPVFPAEPLEDHAEIGADALKNDPDFQEAELGGGVISYIKNAFMNNLPCNERCAQAFSRFIGRVRITQTDRGVIGDEVITEETYQELTEIGGREGGFYAGVEMVEGGAGGGGDADMGGDPDE